MWPGVSAGVMGVYGRSTGRKLPLGMANVSSAAVISVSICSHFKLADRGI